jgi:acetolactate synthase-1/2/3 large subunit
MKNFNDGGEAILQAFRNLGVDYILSSPGSEWSPVWEAMSRQTLAGAPGPSFIDCWHETLAVDMALGYTGYTGRMQAVLLHAGVGLMHGAMAIMSADKAELPMLVMSGESTTFGDDPEIQIEPQFYGGVSEGGSHRFIAPLVKYSTQVTSHATLYHTLTRSAEMAQRTPQGPVYVNVSMEAMLHEWRAPSDLARIASASVTQALPQDVAEIASLLRSAKNPIIVTEGVGRDPAAFDALVAMSDALALPVINGRASTYTNFPRSHDMWLGYSNFAHLAECDLILLVSGRTPWYPPSVRPGCGKIVSIGEYPHKHHLPYQALHADHYLEGDVASALRLLTQAAMPGADEADKITARRARWKAAHGALMADLANQRAAALSATETIDAVALAAVAAQELPADVIICDETITHMPVMRPHLPLECARSFFRVTGGALGQGIGAALGVKLAAPQRPVVLFIGDGSFLYNPIIQALGASKQHGLPIVIVVCNNKRYEAMRKGHVLYYAGGAADSTRFHHGVEIDGPEYHELGSHFGFWGAKVSTIPALREALKEALASAQSGRTAILNVELTK